MAGVERRTRIVLDDQLDRLGLVAACDLGGQPKRQIDAGRHAGGGHDFSRAHQAFVRPRFRTHDPQDLPAGGRRRGGLAVTGPLFGFSDTWQLVINTGTTILTFLMVFLIQATQNRDTMALQLKLNERAIRLI